MRLLQGKKFNFIDVVKKGNSKSAVVTDSACPTEHTESALWKKKSSGLLIIKGKNTQRCSLWIKVLHLELQWLFQVDLWIIQFLHKSG